MVYFRSQLSPMLISLVVGLLALATQALPIDVPGALDVVVPINPPTHIHLLDGSHPSLVKRAVGGIHMSSVPVGPNGRLDVVRRAVGSVADPASDPASATRAASTLEKRSDPTNNGGTAISPIDLPSGDTVVDDLKSATLIPGLFKRSNTRKSPPPAKKSTKPAPPSRVPGKPNSEVKYGRQRAW